MPITGRRMGQNGTVITYAQVRDDLFRVGVLSPLRWNLNNMGYVYRRAPRPSRVVILLHRVVYEHYHGPILPGTEIDHIDRDPLNNLPENLRAVPHHVNLTNTGISRRNKSGVKNVCWYPDSNKWLARIRVNKKTRFIGYFSTLEEAAEAVRQAREKYPPE